MLPGPVALVIAVLLAAGSVAVATLAIREGAERLEYAMASLVIVVLHVCAFWLTRMALDLG
jgi:hypothetical protein